MIVYKDNILRLLKDAGYSSYVLLNSTDKDVNLGSTQLQKLRTGKMIGIAVLEKICNLTGKQPGDLIENIPEDRVEALIRDGYFERKGMPNPR